MGVFVSHKFSFLKEADDDNTETGSNASTTDTAEDNNTTGNKENNDSQTAEDQGNETQEDNGEEEIDADNTEGDDNNFDVDAEPEEDEESGKENNDNNSGDSSSEGSNDDNSSTDTEEKELDRDMFETLSEEEKKQKIITLKRLFSDMYNKCTTIIEKYNDVMSSASDNNEQLATIAKRVVLVLYDLKGYIGDYIISVFDTKSYIENDVMYNRYLSILNGVKIVTKDVAKMLKDQEK